MGPNNIIRPNFQKIVRKPDLPFLGITIVHWYDFEPRGILRRICGTAFSKLCGLQNFWLCCLESCKTVYLSARFVNILARLGLLPLICNIDCGSTCLAGLASLQADKTCGPACFAGQQDCESASLPVSN